METLYPAQDREVKPYHQDGTLQTEAGIPNQPHTTHLAPRFHPMRGNFAHTAQKGYGSEKVFNYIQDVQTAENTTTKTPERPRGELLAQGCGRISEFLAQAPLNEQWEGLCSTHSDIEQYLFSHNNIYCRLAMMLEELPAETIPMAGSNKLEQLHKISQQSMLLGWPGDRLQPEIFTPGFDVVLSEIAEFETLRLGFSDHYKRDPFGSL